MFFNNCIRMKKILLFFIVLSSLNLFSSALIIKTPGFVSNGIITKITCSGAKDGMLKMNAVGGVAPYTYSINGGTFVGTNTFSNLSPGNYNIVTKDATAAVVTSTFILEEPTPLVNTVAISGQNITITATGGTLPYSYSLDQITFTSNATFANLPYGVYTARVKDANGCISDISFTNQATPLVITSFTKTDIDCKGSATGQVSVTAAGGQAPYQYSLGTLFQASNTFSPLLAGSYTATIKDANGYTVAQNFTINEPTKAITAAINIVNQSIVINAQGGTGILQYAISPSLSTFTTNNTFTNLTPGIYHIIVQDQNGCFMVFTATINPLAPLINGKNAIAVTIVLGQTLADIVLDIPNIKWYLKANAASSKSSKTAEASLPLTTVLVPGTTYYASQTVNGIESIERLAVTTSLGTLATTDFDLTKFTYYPNPVKNSLTFSYTSTIDEVMLYAAMGDKILTKKVNAMHCDIDLSDLGAGVYFLTIQSGAQQKTVKILKE